MDIVSVQNDDFDAANVLGELTKNRVDVGGSATFIGYVRDHNDGQKVGSLMLEHYPGMTERALQTIIQQARKRWQILDVAVIHRIGTLTLGEQIVLVAVTAAHRREAFEACDFLMDYLKTKAPFWKYEKLPAGQQRWVQSRESDNKAAERWIK